MINYGESAIPRMRSCKRSSLTARNSTSFRFSAESLIRCPSVNVRFHAGTASAVTTPRHQKATSRTKRRTRRKTRSPGAPLLRATNLRLLKTTEKTRYLRKKALLTSPVLHQRPQKSKVAMPLLMVKRGSKSTRMGA